MWVLNGVGSLERPRTLHPVRMSRYRIPGTFIALLGLLALTAAPAPADTPPDTLVMAKDIGDIITFDPAESSSSRPARFSPTSTTGS